MKFQMADFRLQIMSDRRLLVGVLVLALAAGGCAAG